MDINRHPLPNPDNPVRPLPSASGTTAKEQVKTTDALTIILQWLTYAFWGWTILGLAVLITVILNSIVHGDSYGFTPYGIAAVLVLLPFSFGCDFFYSKREQSKKSGPELLIQAIHAVLFAILGIGALIVFVIGLVNLFITNTDRHDTIVILGSSLLIAFFYCLTFLRTINFKYLSFITRAYKYIMLLLVSIVCAVGFIGPVAAERTTKNDRLLETRLNDLQIAIEDYTRDNQKLPDSLKHLQLQGGAATIRDKKLVTYKPEGAEAIPSQGIIKQNENISNYQDSPSFRYQLCVTYTSDNKYGYNPETYIDNDHDGYSSYLSTYNHQKGYTCYKLETSDSYGL